MEWTAFRKGIGNVKDDRDLERVRAAFDLGQRLHDGQMRKSGEAYFRHPIVVAEILASWGADADTIIAALLHDTVEDTPFTIKEAEKQFGKSVARLIEGVTKLTAEEMERKPTVDEQTETLRKMFKLLENDVRIVVIKLADRLHNMQTIKFLQPARQQAIAQETVDVYVKIAEKLSMHDLRHHLEELSLQLLDAEHFAKLSKLRKSNAELGKRLAKDIQEKLQAEHADILATNHEEKNWEKLEEQFETNGPAVTGVPRLIISLICPDILACYKTLGTLHQLWKREAGSFQDYINSPLPNGYRGLHTTVIMEDGTRVRCKIRTQEMQNYARNGITMLCFDGKAQGITQYVPWARSIGPLVEDTKGDSQEFWEGLQSDILGQFMLVHGPDDRVLQVPMGATALDGAFYLFNKQALRLTSLKVNGRDAPLHQPLKHADSVSASFGQAKTVDRVWLECIHTGLSQAMIRQELAKAPDAQKMELGQALLEAAMRRRGTVGFNELENDAMAKDLEILGVGSIGDLLTHLAEGKINPDRAASLLMHARDLDAQKRREWRLQVDAELPPDLTARLEKYSYGSFAVKRRRERTRYDIRYFLSQNERAELETLLRSRLPEGGWSLVNASWQRRVFAMVTLLVFLWGLDPVLARYLLQGSVTPANLTFLRFATFFFAAAGAYASQSYLSTQKLKPLRPLQPSLLISGFALFITALFSYVTLRQIDATLYILFIIAGISVRRALSQARRGMPDVATLAALFVLLLGILALAWIQGFTAMGILGATISSFGFLLYSHVSGKYQQEEAHIRARYPAFMFWVSTFALILSLTLLPSLTLPSLPIVDLAKAFLFVTVFSVIPYVLYFECMRRDESKLLERTLPFVLLSTSIGEIILTGSLVPLIVAPIIVLFALGNSWRRAKTI